MAPSFAAIINKFMIQFSEDASSCFVSGTKKWLLKKTLIAVDVPRLIKESWAFLEKSKQRVSACKVFL